MKRATLFLIPSLVIIFWSSEIFADDKIYLKNGRRIDGRILEEDEKEIEVSLGFGTAKFSKNEVARIVRMEPQEIPAEFKDGHVFIKGVIEGNVDVTFLIDTGASTVVLSKKIGDRLRSLTPDPQQRDLVEMTVADGRKVKGRLVRLKSIVIKNIEAKDVDAIILLEELGDINFGDALLGMTFIHRYNFRIDYQRKKVIMES